jgi:2-polyprenyl-6-methoxyphenol hydroxylase-like FAD-dependent oxidoreductase
MSAPASRPAIDVLIIGAGPTGLVLALWLTRLGTRVRIVDRADAPGTTSRALAVQARTLELYRQLDLTDAVLEQGHRVPGMNLWVRGRSAARIPLQTLGQDLTPYGPCIFPQDLHERLLIARLQALGVTVERNTELLAFTDLGDRIRATLTTAGQPEQAIEAAYLAGCDGARSVVRQSLGVGFPGATYQQAFYVADVDAAGPALNGELHIDLDEADFLAVFPLKGAGRARLIGTVRDQRAARAESLQFSDVSARAINQMRVQVNRVNWFSTYRVHHRVGEQFRVGRAFLLGDSAHIHSPAGGQGMNTGIGDAINLAWKLNAVLAGNAPDALLDTYEPERRSFARRLVATTDRGFTLGTAPGKLAHIVRTRLVPVVAPALFRWPAARTYLFSAVSQISLCYRDSAISQGKTGKLHGGDRLPWVRIPGGDNFEALQSIGWQVHVYGTAREPLRRWCRDRNLPLHEFAWQSSFSRSTLAADAMYLMRPDMYIGLVSANQDPAPLADYADRHALTLTAAHAMGA